MSAADNMVSFVRGFGQRAKAAKINDALRNYLTNPEAAVAEVNELDSMTGIALERQRMADGAARAAAQKQQQEDKLTGFKRVTSFLRTQPPGSDYGAVIDGISPFLTSGLGMQPEEIAQAKAAIAANPNIITAMDDKAAEAIIASRYESKVMAPGSALAVGGKKVLEQPFPLETKVVPDGAGGNTVVQVDRNRGGFVNPGQGQPPTLGGTGAPISIRNNNPGALRDDGRSKWRGATGTEGGFLTFDTPENGRRAQVINLMNQKRLHGIETLADLVKKYAPSTDGNDPAAYAGTIARGLGVGVTDRINLADPKVAGRVADLMAAVESGNNAATVTGASPQGGARVIMTNPGKGVRTASSEELAAAGYAPGTAAQVDKTGKFVNLKTPPASRINAPTKQADAYRQAQTRLATVYDSQDNLIAAAKDLMTSPNLKAATGFIEGRLPGFTQGRADFIAQLDSFKAQIGFAALQAMRDASKTGGALGNISNFENKALQASLASLERVQSEKQLKGNLQKIIDITTRARKRMGEAVARMPNGGAEPAQQSAPSNAPPVGTTATNPSTGKKVRWNGKGWEPVR